MGRGGGELIISAFFVILWFAGGSEYAEKTGLKLEYNFCTSRQNAKPLLSESDFDIFIGVPMTSGMCSSVGFINSSPVIESELAYAQKPNKDVSEDSLPARERSLPSNCRSVFPTKKMTNISGNTTI